MLKSATRPRADAAAAKPVVMIECLKCGHKGSVDEVTLQRHGEKPDAPIVWRPGE
jgi:hypothetical protein